MASLVDWRMAGRNSDHDHDDDDDKKGQWNRSIASLRALLSLAKVSACGEFGRLEKMAGRNGDHDHDDDDKKGPWNRSIASLRSE